MAYPRGKKGALLALALSGGLWAWQNRDKIGSWINQQKGQLQSSPRANTSSTTSSYTGATRHMSESDLHNETGIPRTNEGSNTPF